MVQSWLIDIRVIGSIISTYTYVYVLDLTSIQCNSQHMMYLLKSGYYAIFSMRFGKYFTRSACGDRTHTEIELKEFRFYLAVKFPRNSFVLLWPRKMQQLNLFHYAIRVFVTIVVTLTCGIYWIDPL